MSYGTRWLPFVLGILFVSGCAATPGEWTKPGTTENQIEHDKAECLFGATEVVPGGPQGGPVRRVNRVRYEGCLADRGYVREKAPE